MSEKLNWSGSIQFVQPRIRLLRSFDQRSHSYLGYLMRVDGTIDGVNRSFTVGIGKALQAKHGLRSGDRAEGACAPIANSEREVVEYYRVSQFRVTLRSSVAPSPLPPWKGVPPVLEVYRARGHRRLAPQTYETRCAGCIWGARMAVEMVIDQWNPSRVKYRQETFCYGPKSCSLYQPGPPRKVPGRKGMSWTEEDWVDLDATSHRSEDE